MNHPDLLVQDPSGLQPREVFAEGVSISGVRRAAAISLAVGDVLAGKYEILGLLGEGGMGTVWRAHSLVLDVDLAIKVLRSEHSDTLAGERLLREAQATAAFGHPAIVRAFDFGQTQAGDPFFAMELLEGDSLGHWIEKHGRMAATQAVQILLPIADGLAAAHARGIVHRDIKPGNIILVRDGEGGTIQPKIVDFGIAKLQKRRKQNLTEAGTVLGSLEYMSPEQADGKEVGEQADVWALCVVLYELMTGRRPFHGDTLSSIILALYTNMPTPTTELAAGDAELWEIIARGLQKSPTDRWPTMRALGRALAGWAAARGVTTDSAGVSLEHIWLGRPSDAFGITRSGRSSSIPPSSLAMSFEVSPQAAPPASSIGVETMATPGATCTGDTPVASPLHSTLRSRPRLGARIAHVAGMLVVASLLTVAGLHAQGVPSTTMASAHADVSVAAPQLPPPPVVEVTPAVTAEVAPSAAPTAQAAQAAQAAPTTRAVRASKASAPSSVRTKRSTAAAMPLPSSPGF